MGAQVSQRSWSRLQARAVAGDLVMISVVPPKTSWTRLSRQSSQSRRRSAGQCSRRSRPTSIRSARAAAVAWWVWAANTRQGIVWPRGNSPSRGVAPASTPNQRPRISQPPVRASTPQVRPRARKPARGDQDLGRSSQCRRGPWVLPGLIRPGEGAQGQHWIRNR